MALPIKRHLKNLERIKNPERDRLNYLRLDKNENTIKFPEEFMVLLRKTLSPDFVATYPEIGHLIRKIANWLSLKEENIYITAGSEAGIKSVFEVFVQKDDRVALLDPTYAMFYVYTKMFQGRLVPIGYKEDLSLSAQAVIEVLEKNKPKLVCIANPNSPTGTVIEPEGINSIIDVASRLNTIVLLDEAYYPFYPISSIGLIPNYPNLIITRTFSKAMGLASARLGIAIGQPQIIEYLYKVRPMYETNAFAVKLAEIIIDNYHLVERNLQEVNRSREYLQGQLRDLGIPYFRSYANFLLIDVGSYEESVRITEALYERKILIKGGFNDKTLRRCLRVSLGSVEQMQCFMQNFRQVLALAKSPVM